MKVIRVHEALYISASFLVSTCNLVISMDFCVDLIIMCLLFVSTSGSDVNETTRQKKKRKEKKSDVDFCVDSLIMCVLYSSCHTFDFS